MPILVLVLAVSAPRLRRRRPAAAPLPAAADKAEAYYSFSLGLQARFAGDAEGALADYRRAQKLDPSSAAIRVEVARLLREIGRVEEALREAQAAVTLDGEDADAHSTLAQLLQIQAAGAEEVLRRAAAEYEQVIRLRSTDGQALLNLAGIYGELRDHAASARSWASTWRSIPATSRRTSSVAPSCCWRG